MDRMLTCTLLLTTLLAGCARTVVENPQNTSYQPNDVNAQLDFWHNLDQRSAISNDEAMHAVLILADETDPTTSYEERLAELKSRGWISENFDEQPDIAVQRGTLARMVAFAIDAPQGVMSDIFNRSPRYALQDLIAIGVMPAGSQLQVIDGREFLGVMALAQDYRTIQDSREAPSDKDTSDDQVPPESVPQDASTT